MKPFMIANHGNDKANKYLLKTISSYVNYTVKCNETAIDGYNVIDLIIDSNLDNDVSIFVSEPNGENQNIIIKGKTEADLYYAVSDFNNIYIPYARNAERHATGVFYVNDLFTKPLKPYNYTATASVKDRGLWLWGYTMYNYVKFIDNMLNLKFNTLIIWNDRLPNNISEVIKYAHSNYIKVYLGFAWGWDTIVPEVIDDNYCNEVSKSVISTFKNNYANLDIDGVYFQSFTEHTNETLGGVSVAEAVTNLVNNVGGKLLSEYPNIKLLFGLHAGSVINRLDAIKKVDERISIIWEDVGAFPYHYISTKTENFDKTVETHKTLRDLRSGGFGAVLKGVICLNWDTFVHVNGEFNMGEESDEFIKNRANEKREILRIVQAGWLKNGKYALELIKYFNYDNMVTCLVEDGMFEEIVNVPTAMYSAMLYNSNRTFEEVLFEVAMRPDVDFV